MAWSVEAAPAIAGMIEQGLAAIQETLERMQTRTRIDLRSRFASVATAHAPAIFNVADLAVVAGAMLLFAGSRRTSLRLPEDGELRRLRG